MRDIINLVTGFPVAELGHRRLHAAAAFVTGLRQPPSGPSRFTESRWRGVPWEKGCRGDVCR
ncbi:hypothetical protein [Actinomadura miaoliensis]|uniref:hypothetical protein n=1 Tax=Actinomadura miaoliensis TaxID=430685 RepID=UPI0031EA8C1D